MSNSNFHLEISCDGTSGNPVAAYVRVRQGRVARTVEVAEGVAFADNSAEGELLGIELLATCRKNLVEEISADEPEEIRQFLRSGVRKGMIFSRRELPHWNCYNSFFLEGGR